MSNVLRRNRATSEVAYVHNAMRIRTELERLVMNEKVFPKRARFIYSVPIIDICRKLMSNANTYYDCTGEDDESFHLYERKRTALENMQDCCEDLLDELKCARERYFIKLSVRENVVGLIVEESELVEQLLKMELEQHTNFMKHNHKVS